MPGPHEAVTRPYGEQWAQEATEAFKNAFGGAGRYPAAALAAHPERDEDAREGGAQDGVRTSKIRAPQMRDSGVPFCALIHSSNPNSGPYGGASFVLFPVNEQPAMIALVVGTQGLSPDEEILGLPGHARKAAAIAAWLNRRHPDRVVAWAKADPTRIDMDVPRSFRAQFPEYEGIFRRYGRVLYAVCIPPKEQPAFIHDAFYALLDVLMEDRGFPPMANQKEDRNRIRDGWMSALLPALEAEEVAELLSERKYVIVEGPPGTGKTRMARELLKDKYAGRGVSIQFHPSTAYEQFVGGLAPAHTGGELGLTFRPAPGPLMLAAAQARKCQPDPYLLHVDEINRADLSKVLGEAVYLLEPHPESLREIDLPYDFPDHGRTLSLPENLHILGTMNSADRSIAVVDLAIRRRFAFRKLWPSWNVVRGEGCSLMADAFQKILELFIDHATPEAFDLIPGHSYFLEKDDARARRRLQAEIAPLLREYLAQGYIAGFASEVDAYLQWIETLATGRPA